MHGNQIMQIISNKKAKSTEYNEDKTRLHDRRLRRDVRV